MSMGSGEDWHYPNTLEMLITLMAAEINNSPYSDRIIIPDEELQKLLEPRELS